MILDRDKQKKDIGKMTELLIPLSNNLCSKLAKLNLGQTEVKNEIDENTAINNLSTKIGEINISEKDEKSSSSHEIKTTEKKVEQNISSKKLSIVGKGIDKLKEPAVEEKKEDNETEDEKETFFPEEAKVVTECKDETNENGTTASLNSRGPVPVQRHVHISHQPYYNVTRTCSRSVLHSGGKVCVAEPVGLQAAIEPQQNKTCMNITQDEIQHAVLSVHPQFEPLHYPFPSENENFGDINHVLKDLLVNYPILSTVLDEIRQSKCTTFQEDRKSDHGSPSSPSVSETSCLESTCVMRKSTSTPSSDGDSGTGTGSPQPFTGTLQEDRISSDERTAIWVRGTQKRQNMGTKSTELTPIWSKPVIPSARMKFQSILNWDRRLRAWAKIQGLEEKDFVVGDEKDGDTQLMIVVCNKCEGQLELIYAMVERMQKITNSLMIHNKAGQSALYLACKVLNEQPLVAAYIAEAMVQLNMDIRNLRYEGGLTLVQILKNEGETHKAVLEELLALRDSNGGRIFSSC